MSDVNDFRLTVKERDMLDRLTVPVPEDEEARVRVLRQAKILDTNQEDAQFDRFTSLTQRIFNVPIVLISLVDVNRQWFKSKIGIELDETHRDVSFCAYTILPDSPEVFVVPDALQDPRFAQNPIVLGPPYIRFYAGAALEVAGVRIGSLCLLDTVPHDNFNMTASMNLLDLGEAVSTLIRERRANSLNLDKERTYLIHSVFQNLKSHLISLENTVNYFETTQEPILTSIKSSEDTDNSLHQEIQLKISQLSLVKDKLMTSYDAALQYSAAMLANIGEKKKKTESDFEDEDIDVSSAIPCNIYDIINVIKSKLISTTTTTTNRSVTITSDDYILSMGTHVTHPDAIQYLLFSTYYQHYQAFLKTDIHMSFRMRNDGSSMCVACQLGESVIQGNLIITIRTSDPIPLSETDINIQIPTPVSTFSPSISRSASIITMNKIPTVSSYDLPSAMSPGPATVHAASEERIIQRLLDDIHGTVRVIKLGSGSARGVDEFMYEFTIPCIISSAARF